MDLDRQRFLDWLTTPPEARDPKKQTEVAEELGVSNNTLAKWKREPEFLREWESIYYATIGDPARKQQIMDTLFATATDPDDPKHVQAAGKYFEAEGTLKPQARVDLNIGARPLSELTDEDLAALAAMAGQDELAARRERDAS